MSMAISLNAKATFLRSIVELEQENGVRVLWATFEGSSSRSSSPQDEGGFVQAVFAYPGHRYLEPNLPRELVKHPQLGARSAGFSQCRAIDVRLMAPASHSAVIDRRTWGCTGECLIGEEELKRQLLLRRQLAPSILYEIEQRAPSLHTSSVLDKMIVAVGREIGTLPTYGQMESAVRQVPSLALFAPVVDYLSAGHHIRALMSPDWWARHRPHTTIDPLVHEIERVRRIARENTFAPEPQRPTELRVRERLAVRHVLIQGAISAPNWLEPSSAQTALERLGEALPAPAMQADLHVDSFEHEEFFL